MKRLIAAIALGVAACGQGGAQLTVEKTEYRAPLGASGIGVAYFSVTSATADRIVSVSSPQADRGEMHASVTEGALTSMKRQLTLDLPAGKPVIFGPNGLHLMVFAPQPLQPGATFPIQIELESGRIETIPFHPAFSGAVGH